MIFFFRRAPTEAVVTWQLSNVILLQIAEAVAASSLFLSPLIPTKDNEPIRADNHKSFRSLVTILATIDLVILLLGLLVMDSSLPPVPLSIHLPPISHIKKRLGIARVIRRQPGANWKGQMGQALRKRPPIHLSSESQSPTEALPLIYTRHSGKQAHFLEQLAQKAIAPGTDEAPHLITSWRHAPPTICVDLRS